MTSFIEKFTALPNLHPALVHFPIALLTVALGFDLACLLFRRHLWLDRSATALYLFGALGTVAAYITGSRAAEGIIDVPPNVHVLISEHSDWARYTLWMFLILALTRLMISWFNRHHSIIPFTPKRLIFVLMALMGQWLLFETAYRGWTLVRRHAVGVTSALQPVRELEEKYESLEFFGSSVDRLFRDEDGSITWELLPHNAAALGTPQDWFWRSSGTAR